MQADTKKIIELLFFLFSAQSIVGQIDMLNMFSIAMSLRIWNTSSRVGAPPNLDNAADTKIVKLLFFSPLETLALPRADGTIRHNLYGVCVQSRCHSTDL